eukprot:15465521-Alexandrium_andersonii.AAC.1
MTREKATRFHAQMASLALDIHYKSARAREDPPAMSDQVGLPFIEKGLPRALQEEPASAVGGWVGSEDPAPSP